MDVTWQGGDAVRVDLAHRDADVGLRVRTPYSRRRRLLRWHVETANAVTEVTEPHGWVCAAWAECTDDPCPDPRTTR